MSLRDRALRVFVGDGGPGAVVGTVALIGVGVALIASATIDLRLAVQLSPKRLACADFIADPTQAQWVVLEGCRLDLNAATTRRWKGWWSRADAGQTGRHLELFIPISPLGTAQPERPRVVLATTDQALLTLVEMLDRIPTDQLDAFIDTKAGEIEAVLAPKELKAAVAPVTSSGSRAALAEMMVDDAVVLEQGREPKRVSALCTLLMGFAVLLFAFGPMARRFQLERELGGDP